MFFSIYRKSYIFYLDRGYYFDYKELREFLRYKNITINYSSTAFYKLTDMIKVINKILKGVVYKLKKE